MYDDMKNEKKTYGQAVVHNGIGLGITIFASAFGTPILGFFAGAGYEAIYSNSKVVQNILDSLGQWLDKAGDVIAEGNLNLGQAFQVK